MKLHKAGYAVPAAGALLASGGRWISRKSVRARDPDPQMPINQSHELQGRYEALGLDVAFDVVHEAAHGGRAFFEGKHLTESIEFPTRTIG